MAADRQAGVQRTGAMLVEAGGLFRDGRLEEAIAHAWLQCLACQERDDLVEHEGVGGDAHIVRDGVGEPAAVVRYARAHALARVRKPPVLDVALDELAARGPDEMFAGHRRADRGERHAILQLVPEAIGAAGLVETRSRPDAAREGLIGQPAVEHDVHRPVGGLDLNRPDNVVPETSYIRQHNVEISLAVTGDQRPRLDFIRSIAEQEDDLGDTVRRNLNPSLESGAG